MKNFLLKINDQFFAGQANKKMFSDEQHKRLKKRVVDSVTRDPLMPSENEIYNTLKAQSI